MQENQGSVLPTLPLPYATSFQAFQSNYPGLNEITNLNNSQPFQYDKKAAKGFGIFQMIIGIFCLILNIVTISIDQNYPPATGYGIWGGILISVAGLLQVISAKRNVGSFLIFGTKLMCVIATCTSFVIFCYAVLEATCGRYCYKSGYMKIVLGSIMAILSIIVGVISIKSSDMYRGMCKSLPKTFTPVYIIVNQPTTFQSHNPGQPIVPQVPHDLSPEALMKSGGANNQPPSYEDVLNQVEKADELKQDLQKMLKFWEHKQTLL